MITSFQHGPGTGRTQQRQAGTRRRADMKGWPAPRRSDDLVDVVDQAIIDADLVINVPKLKTHKKAGVTGALKNLVGINGNKEFLPHHRKGGAASGGDCYPGRSPIMPVADLCEKITGQLRLFS